jgi:hypothetical protein
MISTASPACADCATEHNLIVDYSNWAKRAAAGPCGSVGGALEPEQRRTRRKNDGLRRRGRAIVDPKNELF